MNVCSVGVLLFVMTSCQTESASKDASTKERTSGSDAKRHCCIRVTIEPTDDLCEFLLTFLIEPNNHDYDYDPTFYMGEEISYGAGLKIKKIFPPDENKTKESDRESSTDRGKIITIASKPISEMYTYYDVFDDKESRKVMFQQQVCLQDRFPSEEGLYVVSYEHPWENIKGGNMQFVSNQLLVNKGSWQRHHEISNLFKNNPKRELASYQMTHLTVSENADYGRPLEYFNDFIQAGMSYDEILYLMGSPDSFHVLDNEMHWSYEASPVGGLVIDFVDGKVVRKGFAGDSDEAGMSHP
jgi:hypothetical protein